MVMLRLARMAVKFKTRLCGVTTVTKLAAIEEDLFFYVDYDLFF